jgi:hypothetical protein
LAAVLVSIVAHKSISRADSGAALQPMPIAKALPSLGELAMMPANDLAEHDIALLNLRCAEGLPGAEQLDIDECLKTISRWASRVEYETKRNLHRFVDNPANFENSEAYYRMMMLITVLQQDFGVRYNPKRIREVDFTKSQDLFIHGMIDSDNGGTCVSMPVLYTAVARRLGYPVSLATAKEHVFCRWDGEGERFNIEATSQGMSSYDDAYYMSWPKPMSQAEVDAGHYLKSLDAAESLATFLAARGHCLQDTGRLAEARVAYALAAEKAGSHPIYHGFLASTVLPRRTHAPRGNQFAGQSGVYPRHQANFGTNPDPNVAAYAPNPQSWQQPGTIRGNQAHDVYRPADPFTGTPNGFPQQQPAHFPNPANPGFGFQP